MAMAVPVSRSFADRLLRRKLCKLPGYRILQWHLRAAAPLISCLGLSLDLRPWRLQSGLVAHECWALGRSSKFAAFVHAARLHGGLGVLVCGVSRSG